jgi:hypothetical protein
MWLQTAQPRVIASSSPLSLWTLPSVRGYKPIVLENTRSTRPSGTTPRALPLVDVLFASISLNLAANPAAMWRQDESGRVHTPLEPLVLAATLALIPVVIIEADATGGWRTSPLRQLGHLGRLRRRRRRLQARPIS